MRGGFTLLAFYVLLAACQQEPSFDERYAEQSKVIEKQGKSIESTVDQRLKAAQEAEAALGQTTEIEPAGSNHDQ